MEDGRFNIGFVLFSQSTVVCSECVANKTRCNRSRPSCSKCSLCNHSCQHTGLEASDDTATYTSLIFQPPSIRFGIDLQSSSFLTKDAGRGVPASPIISFHSYRTRKLATIAASELHHTFQDVAWPMQRGG
ncbi:hypothetical protein N7495_004036 [Penicillium taxi]|uniref:uncharacterized protein n=1 Tax=Penicillium taxi TaxID=168475 RepID=UPI002544FCDB|nr:uncharacterized protein N7495_004036 [Penicillium taxi]KAJ5899292.1 hypothetical protein N7495_004036 [Penicillium taxi]